MRSLSVVAALAAVLAFSGTSSSIAASADHRADHRTNASYASGAAAQSSRAGAVPANCIRQECGKLWCWDMRGKTSGR